jgi:Amt family ammonium transporter
MWLGIHGVGGVIGTLSLGLFASTSVSSGGVNGLFYGGGMAQFGKQLFGVVGNYSWSNGYAS